MSAYYNEFDKDAAAWLRELIRRNLIAPGDVDTRSITDVRPDDLRGYAQCHFFAGIGGWSRALRLAGVPDDARVWTGSCPCQPFSAAGKQRGSDDERHLWPAFFDLIRECRPGIVFGEQVAGAAGYAWWDHVAADLEGENYAAAAADIGAHSVGAPHLRQRLYWVADGTQVGRRQERQDGSGFGARDRAQGWPAGLDAGGIVGELGDTDTVRPPRRSNTGGGEGLGVAWSQPAGASADGVMGDTDMQRPQGRPDAGMDARRWEDEGRPLGFPGGDDPWAGVEWIACTDGKSRPTEPGIFPLVDGLPEGLVRGGNRCMAPGADASGEARVMRLRGYGNAIVPALAAAFVRAAV